MARKKDPVLMKARRDQVIAAVIDLLCERSHYEVTLDDVAKRAGVSKGLVTYYFANKDELLVAAIQHYHAEQRDLLSAAVIGDSRALLERLLLAAFPNRASVERELRFQLEIWAYAKRKPEVRVLVSEAYREFRRACAALLSPSTPEDVDGEWAYSIVHALVDGLSIQVALDESVSIEELRARALVFVEYALRVGQRR